MGDWAKQNAEELKNRGAEFESASEMLKEKQKEATDFVENNELFGADTGAKAVLEELGFNTEGFGTMGNDPSANPPYSHTSSSLQVPPTVQNKPSFKQSASLKHPARH